LPAGSEGLGVVVDPNKDPKGFVASAGFAGVSSVGVFAPNRLVLFEACVERFANGLLTAGFSFSPSEGFDAAAPNRGLKGEVSAGLEAVSTVVVVFGAKIFTAGLSLSPSDGFDAAGVAPKRGLNAGAASAGLEAVSSVVVVFGAKIFTAGLSLSPSDGFNAAGVAPKRGLNAGASAGLEAV
jgi:hypothetical protein